jgi:hypothetical protein
MERHSPSTLALFLRGISSAGNPSAEALEGDMRLDFVGVDPENPDDQCPAVFRDPGTGDFYMQGETVTSPGILAWINPDSRILDTESLGNPCHPRPLPPAQQARQALADQLREIRLAAGLTVRTYS